MNIGIDIDGVIIDFYGPFLEFFNKKNNSKLKIEDLSDHDFSKVFNISREEAHNLVLEFYDAPEFEKINLIEKAKESIEELNKKHKIIFITSRPRVVEEETKKNLKEIFPDLDLEIYHTRDYTGKALYKSEICLEKNIDVMIEDCVENANKITKKGIKCFLLERPWNVNHNKHPEIICTQNWEDILDHLRK